MDLKEGMYVRTNEGIRKIIKEYDKELSDIYNKLNETKFRNYIYDYDKKGFYCDYIDEYECKIDELLEQNQQKDDAIDECIELLKDYKDYPTMRNDIIVKEVLEKLQQAKGGCDDEC